MRLPTLQPRPRYLGDPHRVHAPAGVARQMLAIMASGSRREALAAMTVPTLVIHGEQDDVVPMAAVFDWARPASLPVTVIPGAGHFFHGQLPLLKQLVIGAFAH